MGMASFSPQISLSSTTHALSQRGDRRRGLLGTSFIGRPLNVTLPTKLRVPVSDGKFRERSFFQVRTWENERHLSPTPHLPMGNGHVLLVTQILWLAQPSWGLASLCEQSG